MREGRLRTAVPALSMITLLGGCFRTDLEPWAPTLLPFSPMVGGPEGWVVEGKDLELTCPDGKPARYYWVYPEAVAAPEDQQAILMPLVILFHSGAFDFVFEPEPTSPNTGLSFQDSREETPRLSAEWAEERVFATLGMYPNYDGVEQHTGALPAALAAKGFAMLLPTNCWGDYWHNRSSDPTSENNFQAEFFFREGRTAAEFTYLHATTAFPPGKPAVRPFGIDQARIYVVGLGEGARAATELINLRATTEDGAPGALLYQPAGMVLDSPIDDLRTVIDTNTEYNEVRQSGLSRIWPDGREGIGRGSLGFTPLFAIPQRTALLASASDTELTPNANGAALTQLGRLGSDNAWYYQGGQLAHVLTNADVELAKVVADYLADGIAAVPPALQTPIPAPAE